MEQAGNQDFEISYASVSAVALDGDRDGQRDHRSCPRRGCHRLAADDSEYYTKHEDDIRRYKREYGARQRARWLADGCCTRCGARERRSGSMWCSACLIRLDRMPQRDQDLQRDHRQTRGERVAKRLIAWTNSPHNEGRVRMRGGKRGAPSAQDRDRRDLADIRRVLDRYALALDEAYGAETQALSRIQRDATVRAAHAGLALAVRLGMEALVTYGYECPVLAEDFDPGDDGIDHDLITQGREIVKSGR